MVKEEAALLIQGADALLIDKEESVTTEHVNVCAVFDAWCAFDRERWELGINDNVEYLNHSLAYMMLVSLQGESRYDDLICVRDALQFRLNEYHLGLKNSSDSSAPEEIERKLRGVFAALYNERLLCQKSHALCEVITARLQQIWPFFCN